MNNKLFLLLLIVVSSSCSTLYIANSGIDPIVFTKPVYADSITANTYMGGKINRSTYTDPMELLRNNYFGQAHIFQTITGKYLNSSYGAFGYMGKIIVKDAIDNIPTGYKNYFGGGISADIQLNIPVSNFNLKPIGFKGSLMYEDGEYNKWRRQQMGSVGNLMDNTLLNISQTIGANYQFLNKNTFGLDASAGYTYMIPHLYMDMTFSIIVNYCTPKYAFYIQRSATVISQSNDLVFGMNIKLK